MAREEGTSPFVVVSFMRLSLRFGVIAVLVAGSVVACGSNGLGGLGGGGSSSGNPEPDPTNIGQQARADLKACSTGTSETSFDDSLEIASGFRQSCHELVVCGGLSMQMSTAVIQVIVNAALGATGKGGFVFDGKGTYNSAPDQPGTNMSITLLLPKDTSFGKTGDVIDFDLLDVNNYFKSAEIEAIGKVSTDGTSEYSLHVKFTDVGPGFELLGLTRTGNEMSFDQKATGAAIGAIRMKAKTHVDDKQGKSSFVYDMTSPETTLGALFDGGGLAFTLDGVSGGRADLGQKLETTRWEVQYVGGKIGKLDGTIGFEITGGPLQYGSTFTYDKTNEPVVKFACP